MSSVRSEHDCAKALPESQRYGFSHVDSADQSSRTGRPDGRGLARSRCVVVLGSTAPKPLDKIIHRVTGRCAHEATVRRVACERDGSATGHAALKGLLGAPDGQESSACRVAEAASARVDALVAQAPLVLVLTEAQWCDDGTLRWLDRLLRRPSAEQLTVLMTSSRGALSAAGATFHEFVARAYCTVTDVADLLPADAGHPSGADFDYLVRHEPHLLRVAQAAAVLRSTDADLVGALSQLPAHLVVKALRTAREVGMVPDPMPPTGVPHHVDALPATLPEAESRRMYVRAADILNDAARPAEQVADALLAQPTLDKPWMISLLKEAACATRHDNPATAVRYLSRLHRIEPDDVAVRVDLGTALLDIDPVAAREHLEWARLHTNDPMTTARTAIPLRLSALMTHEDSDAPRQLGANLAELRAGLGVEPLAGGLVARTAPGDDGDHDAPDAAERRDDAHPIGEWPATAAPHPGGSAGHIALATRALRAALTATALQDAVDDAYQVLRADEPRSAWATVAAVRVLGLADHTSSALDHLARSIADSQRRKEVWAECHARSGRASLLLQMGEVTEAASQARAALRIAQRHGWEAQTRLPIVTLATAMLARAETDRAESTLRGLDGRRFDDSAWEDHHHLMARAVVHLRRGRAEPALSLLRTCGTSLAAAGIDNPVFTTWWVISADVLMRLGRRDEAVEHAALGQRLAERWPTRRSVGLSLLARGLTAKAPDRLDLLTESVRALAESPDRPYHALAELRLGRTLLDLGDKKAARAHLHTSRSMAGQHGLLVMAGRAHDCLATAGGRAPATEDGAPDNLTAAERPVADLAATGATNREIATTLCLTVRTVEYHLTKIYRKLGATGRSDLAERLESDSAPEPTRALGDAR